MAHVSNLAGNPKCIIQIQVQLPHKGSGTLSIAKCLQPTIGRSSDFLQVSTLWEGSQDISIILL